MKERTMSFMAGVLTGAILISGSAAYAAGVMAEHTLQRVYVDGTAVQMDAYSIGGYNYVKRLVYKSVIYTLKSWEISWQDVKRMTRQKKELLKKIEEMKIWIDINTELGCGFAPPDVYDRMYEEIYRLQEELAHLRHYKTVEEMYYDERGQATVDEILRQAKPARNQKPRRNNSREIGR